MIEKTIEKLLIYAKKNLYLDEQDIIYKRNILLDILNLSKPYEGEVKENENSFSIDELVNELKDDGVEEKTIIRICGVLSPLPSIINNKFFELKMNSSIKATAYFYDLCVKNFYVQKTQIKKNINSVSSNGIELSINLSKPEKNNADIKKALSEVNVNYPKCAICLENVGFKGEGKMLPRGNLRTINFDFDNDKWFFQYSPYGYFDEHFILVKNNHEPMKLSDENIETLFKFIKEFPHYVIGSNSDLPISGGSILTHEHFQGGKHVFPIMKRKTLKEYRYDDIDNVKISKLDWYASTIVVEGKDALNVLKASKRIIHFWNNYDDFNINIISKDNEQHNSVTLLLQLKDNVYRLFIVLRNNLTTKEYPDGYFHAHKQYHIIKKEGIGLIEEGGRFILPARLYRQLNQIKDIIKNNYSYEEYVKIYPDMIDFKDFINEVIDNNKEMPIDKAINETMGRYCEEILKNTSVFKDDDIGKASFDKFIKELGLKNA